MFVLLAAGIGTGLVTAALLIPVSLLAALIITPLVASTSALLACFLIAWRNTREDGRPQALDHQTDAMVAALRGVAGQAAATSPAPKVPARRQKVA